MARISEEFAIASGYGSTFEFWKAMSGVSNGVLNDHIDAALGKCGYTGSVNDKLTQFGKRLTGLTDINDSLGKISALLGGMLFFKDFKNSQATLNADFSIGSATATYTCTRASGSPGTYVDASGVVRLMAATDNLPRYQGGYYDETGFHVGNAGLMVEGAMTNRATYSGTPEDAAWTKTNITAANADVGSGSPDGVATANSLTASAGNGSFTQAYTDASAGVYTASLWIKRKTGTGVVNLRANTGDAYTAITTSVTSGWTRVSVSSTSLTNPTFDLQLVTSGDAVYVYGMQLEKNPYMTSYIPNATTALARGAEVLKYLIAGNRRADEESIYVGFIPGWSSATQSSTPNLTDSDTKRRQIGFNGTSRRFDIKPNGSDASTIYATHTTALSANTKYVLAGVVQVGSPQSNCFLNGVSEGTSAVNTWDGAMGWGTNFNIGSRSSDGTLNLNGVVQSIVIIGKANTATEVSANTSLLNAL
jgi:hypothetical protein